jgi:D-hexose-6-phosphate mutarotase
MPSAICPHVQRAKAIADLGDEDYKHYVCVEPGKVSADAAAFEAHTALAPGKMWSLIQQLQLNFE